MDVFNRQNIMLDIETLSKRQNAVILSIGAVKFTFEEGLKEEFYINIDPSTCAKVGLHVDPDTVKWWLSQDATVRNALLDDQKSIITGLNDLNDFVGKDKKQFLWSQGSVFDFGILASAFEATDVKCGWDYWQALDCRTVFKLIGFNHRTAKKTYGALHDALDDAKNQADLLIKALKP